MLSNLCLMHDMLGLPALHHQWITTACVMLHIIRVEYLKLLSASDRQEYISSASYVELSELFKRTMQRLSQLCEEMAEFAIWLVMLRKHLAAGLAAQQLLHSQPCSMAEPGMCASSRSYC